MDSDTDLAIRVRPGPAALTLPTTINRFWRARAVEVSCRWRLRARSIFTVLASCGRPSGLVQVPAAACLRPIRPPGCSPVERVASVAGPRSMPASLVPAIGFLLDLALRVQISAAACTRGKPDAFDLALERSAVPKSVT